ncbi:hypothetical protein PPL_10453 [Heterostelium album PN500]|uniref:Uncharacterized protein n=1 Tax=Heterostelium pallidum (strain ATCC 26659 / Pp 5 / PN500) TaxID=670386 RepID=D3BR49_HETP5|nr:hypothetical protein PPL_10453 [Heterostelium album PN500]EFA75881.1 hypothetical protein PPL_10453 [Heterostelium album PN500]|eukprot:XP_020428015.1 hypothetical protein PPL_10453 [Heterostelium album PN500]
MNILASASQSIWWKIGGLSAASAVGLGAFGSHGLKKKVSDPVKLDYWKTASHYHLLHSIAIMMAPFSKNPNFAGVMFTSGVVLFSGSLYYMTVGQKKMGFVPPIGGVGLIAGWLALVLLDVELVER